MSKTDFFARLKEHPRPVVVDFWAPWCSPCRWIEPTVKQLEAEYGGRVDVWKVNADEQPEVLQSLRVYGIPTLVAFHQGQEVARRTGVVSALVLSTLFEAALSGETPLPSQPTLLSRLLRLAAGTAMFVLAGLGHFSGIFLFLAGLGAVFAFSAVYDRCPIYRAVSSRLSAWLRRDRSSHAEAD